MNLNLQVCDDGHLQAGLAIPAKQRGVVLCLRQAVVRLASVGTNVSRLCTRIHLGYAAILYGDVETMASLPMVVTGPGALREWGPVALRGLANDEIKEARLFSVKRAGRRFEAQEYVNKQGQPGPRTGKQGSYSSGIRAATGVHQLAKHYFTANSHVSTQQASRNPRRDELHFPLPIAVADSGGLTGMRDSVKGASGITPIPTKRGVRTEQAIITSDRRERQRTHVNARGGPHGISAGRYAGGGISGELNGVMSVASLASGLLPVAAVGITGHFNGPLQTQRYGYITMVMVSLAHYGLEN
ncbi:hypothetical protein An07g03240 [Aspergillus niger]|uniref:Uncharacterized protein n=2 Tax=Aspergillus niger TaxID=5061 RepID=A2QMT4_ASPNC|nr:hypothetical protein An07g03240 [Aspergillus niger]CAL00258.1 hypothetical protein An07g03240 [Aspergillus niger]